MSNGASQTSNISNSSEAVRSRWLTIALLLGVGLLAGYLHQVFRWPLKLPGRHGLEFMALMVFARCAAGNLRLAGSTVGTGSAAMTILLSHGLALEPLIFILQGLALDFVYPKVRATAGWITALALTAAAVHTLKPLLQWAIALSTGLESGSLASGLAYPVATHLLFGGIGGLCGALVWKATQKRLRGPI